MKHILVQRNNAPEFLKLLLDVDLRYEAQHEIADIIYKFFRLQSFTSDHVLEIWFVYGFVH